MDEEKNRLSQPEQMVSDEETEKQERKKTKKPGFEFYEMLHELVCILAIATIIFVFVVRLVGVDGESMLPTLHNYDYLLLESNFLYRPDEIENGDVVVLYTPLPDNHADGPIVKRVIATEGQVVDIDFTTGDVFVDGVKLEEPYIKEPIRYQWDGNLSLDYPVTVPENCIFILGDNRNNSLDSRYAPLGMVDKRCVLGKVLVIALPGQTRDELGRITDPRDWSRIGLVS